MPGSELHPCSLPAGRRDAGCRGAGHADRCRAQDAEETGPGREDVLAGPVYPVRLRVRTPAVHRLPWAPGTTITEVAERAGGWSDVTMTFENVSEATAFLPGMAGDAVVITPDELRDRIRTVADRLARLHAG
jgi:hypothetical protein